MWHHNGKWLVYHFIENVAFLSLRKLLDFAKFHKTSSRENKAWVRAWNGCDGYLHFSLSIMHRICFPQPTTQKWINILHKHCFQCLLGSKIVPKVTAKQRMQDLGGANKVQRFEKILVVKDLSHLCSKEAEVKRMCLSLFHSICWGYEMKIIVNDFSDLSNDHH